MGIEGDRQTAEGSRFCEQLLPRLEALGGVSSRKMFGGYGLFHETKMFGLVTSQGELFLKVDDSNRARFEQARAPQHGKMPYFRIPATALAETSTLLDWAKSALEVAHA